MLIISRHHGAGAFQHANEYGGDLFQLDPATVSILQYADNGVCVLFFTDFVISFYQAERKWEYLFLRFGWLDLLSSIPMIDAMRLGRIARIVRIIRLLRGVRATRILAEFVISRGIGSAFLAVALVSILLFGVLQHCDSSCGD